MKPQLHKLPLLSGSSFLYNRWTCDHFDKPWHFHEEYELVLIDKSRGTKFIGDNVSLFEDGNLILIGSNIPHLFRNNEEYYTEDNKLEASSTFIHFTDQFLGNNFFNLPEMSQVQKLLINSSLALEIHGQTKKYSIQKLHDMQNENPPQRLLSILEILIKLSESKELRPLLSTQFNSVHTTNTKDSERIHKVFEFILKNYNQEIYVTEVAEMLNMSGASFSRYFKHHMRKTFSNYVTEIRVSHACRMLMHGEKNISEISYLSGFENLSNFYRHFRKITGVIPKDYRNRFLKLGNEQPSKAPENNI